MAETNTLQADVIVVGTGPGGASVARELAQKGKNVLLLERGLTTGRVVIMARTWER